VTITDVVGMVDIAHLVNFAITRTNLDGMFNPVFHAFRKFI